MIESENLIVSAGFDSGTFTGRFHVHPKAEGYNRVSIQDKYDMSFKDFDDLTLVIAIAVEEYLLKKEKK